MRFCDQQKKKAFTLSYDDGVTQDIRFIELINKYNLKCTFNLNSELLGKNGMLIREGKRIAHYKVQAADVREIYAGHEVAAHTLTHPMLTEQSDAEIIRQVAQDKENLEQLVGYEVVGMAYPGGGINYSSHVADVIRANTGIRYCRTTVDTDSFDLQENLYEFKPNVSHINWERMFSMAEDFVALNPDKPQVFYVWGHSYEMDYDNSYWSRLEELFQLVAGRDDIFYGTNAEVLL